MRRHRLRKARGGDGPLVDPVFAEELIGRRPSGISKGRPRNARREQKTLQLCRQVERALSFALAGECDDDVLGSLYVADVSPAPDASRLLVRLAIPNRLSAAATLLDVLGRVDRVHGKLRAAVAAAITRKRAPELTFVVIAEGEVSP